MIDLSGLPPKYRRACHLGLARTAYDLETRIPIDRIEVFVADFSKEGAAEIVTIGGDVSRLGLDDDEVLFDIRRDYLGRVVRRSGADKIHYAEWLQACFVHGLWHLRLWTWPKETQDAIADITGKPIEDHHAAIPIAMKAWSDFAIKEVSDATARRFAHVTA